MPSDKDKKPRKKLSGASIAKGMQKVGERVGAKGKPKNRKNYFGVWGR